MEEKRAVLVTSIARKVPLLQAVRAAMQKSKAFDTLFGYDSNPSCIGKYFIDQFYSEKRLSELSHHELLSYCKTHNIQAIIPTRDGELPYFAEMKALANKEGIDILISPSECIALAEDKLAFFEEGVRKGFPMIPTALSIQDLATERYVVKERRETGSRYTGIDLNAKETERMSGKILDPIFQPFIEGIEVSIDLYRTKEGEVLGPVVRERNYISQGESQITTTFSHKEIEEMTTRFAKEINLYGHAVFQGILQEDGEFLFSECNARFGGASSLAVAYGLDSFYFFFKECLGESVDASLMEKSPTHLRLVRYPQDMIVPWSFSRPDGADNAR